MSEAAKYQALVSKYCVGNGADIGSGGAPMVPHAISIELPEAEFAHYNSNHPPKGPLHFRAVDAVWHLPFKDQVLDWIGASHLLEDFPREQWNAILWEWTRVLKVGGYLILLVPDKALWNYAIEHLGQPCNCAHCFEPSVGDFTEEMNKLGCMEVVEDRLTEAHPNDYTILCVARRRE